MEAQLQRFKLVRKLRFFIHLDKEITGRTTHNVELENVQIPDSLNDLFGALNLRILLDGDALRDYEFAGDLFPITFWALNRVIRFPESYYKNLSEKEDARNAQIGHALKILSTISRMCWLYPQAKIAIVIEEVAEE